MLEVKRMQGRRFETWHLDNVKRWEYWHQHPRVKKQWLTCFTTSQAADSLRPLRKSLSSLAAGLLSRLLSCTSLELGDSGKWKAQMIVTPSRSALALWFLCNHCCWATSFVTQPHSRSMHVRLEAIYLQQTSHQGIVDMKCSCHFFLLSCAGTLPAVWRKDVLFPALSKKLALDEVT